MTNRKITDLKSSTFPLPNKTVLLSDVGEVPFMLPQGRQDRAAFDAAKSAVVIEDFQGWADADTFETMTPEYSAPSSMNIARVTANSSGLFGYRMEATGIGGTWGALGHGGENNYSIDLSPFEAVEVDVYIEQIAAGGNFAVHMEAVNTDWYWGIEDEFRTPTGEAGQFTVRIPTDVAGFDWDGFDNPPRSVLKEMAIYFNLENYVVGDSAVIQAVRGVPRRPAAANTEHKTANYTLTADDIGKTLVCTDMTLTIPDDIFPVGSQFAVIQKTEDPILITAGANDVTFEYKGTDDSEPQTSAKFGVAVFTCLRRGISAQDDIWHIAGDVEPQPEV